MKKLKIMIAGAAFCYAVSGVLFADPGEAGKAPSSKMKNTVAPSELPVDRTLEFRVGPRASFLTGDLRVGKGGTVVDVYDGLGMDEPSAGVQMDFDVQPFNTWQPWDWKPLSRLHLSFGYTYDQYDHTRTTKKNILTDRGDTILSGASVHSDFDAHSYEFKLGYDLYTDKTWRIQPYVGGKVAEIEGRISASGNVTTAAPGSVTLNGTRTATYSNDKATFLGGVDTRAYLTRSWYVGGDISGFGYDRWSYVT